MAELNDTFSGGASELSTQTSDSGESWTKLTDASSESILLDGSGRVYLDSGSVALGIYYSSWTPPTADYLVKVTARAASASGDLGIVARLTGTTWSNGSYYMARYEAGTGYQLFKNVTGSYTQLGSTDSGTSAPANGDTLELDVSGSSTTTVRLLKNGSQLISVDDSSSPLTSAGKVGLWMAGPMSTTTGYQADRLQTESTTALTANIASVASVSSGAATIAGTAALGGVDTKSYQLQRGTDGSTFGTNVGSPQVLSGSTAPSNQADSGLTNGTAYAYRWSVTDSAGSPATVNSDALWVVPHAAGTTFYVATAGSDSNAGTSTGSPWQTLTKVNRYLSDSILAGDSLLFNGGDTFTGSLRVTSAPGTSGSGVVTIGRYGTGNPTFDCANSYAVWLEDCQYTTVTGLTVEGSGVTSAGVTTSTDAGIKATLAGSSNLLGITISGNTISGCFYGVLLSVASGNANSFTAPTVSGNTISECGFVGIFTRQLPWVTQTKRFTDAVVSGNTISLVYGANNTALTNQGDFAADTQSGFGIIVANMTNGVVSGNDISDCGEAGSAAATGGSCGIMTAVCAGTIIRSNEISGQQDPTGTDGMGIDTDGSSQDCIVERNYVHGCDACAFMDFNIGGAFSQNSGNIFRYNISENNGRRVAEAGDGAHPCTFISLSGSVDSEVYNNTEYSAIAAGSEVNSISDNSTSGAVIRNNILVASGSGAKFGNVKNGTLLQGNLYYATGTATFSLTYNSVEKTSLGALQGVAEDVGGNPSGYATDPQLVSLGGGSAASYSPASALSAVVGTGLDLFTLFTTDIGNADYNGLAVSLWDGFNIGAVATSVGGQRRRRLLLLAG